MRHGQQISSVSKPVIRRSGCFTAIRGIPLHRYKWRQPGSWAIDGLWRQV